MSASASLQWTGLQNAPAADVPGVLDRRVFLGAATAAVGLTAAAAILPLSARAMGLPARAGAEPSIGESRMDRESWNGGDTWDIDDMWGHAPRYAHPIPYSPMRTSPIEWESVDPVDRMLVI